METSNARRQRKQEGKRLKRQKIEESGGVRPRNTQSKDAKSDNDAGKATKMVSNRSKTQPSSFSRPFGSERQSIQNENGRKNKRRNDQSSAHRFGRVMEYVPCRNKPRRSTVSVAVPGSVIANCQTREQKTQLAGQIARAATIYHVDEIIVYDDKLSPSRGMGRSPIATNNDETQRQETPEEGERKRFSEPNAFLARVLQFCECPQYLRRVFFPMHPDLQFAGMLAPIDAPHHVRAEDHCPYREGVVMEKKTLKGSLVNCGIRGRPVNIEQRLQPGLRCTIQIDPNAYKKPGPLHGKVVSPRVLTETDGTYWGYTVRMASSLQAVWNECPFDSAYDLKIGTSERGNDSVDAKKFRLPSYKHALIVLGGVAGLEECVDADESLKIGGKLTHTLFDKWVNICPFQGSRTIRTEEAILITLARLSPSLLSAGTNDEPQAEEELADEASTKLTCDDTRLSEESSEDDDE